METKKSERIKAAKTSYNLSISQFSHFKLILDDDHPYRLSLRLELESRADINKLFIFSWIQWIIHVSMKGWQPEERWMVRASRKHSRVKSQVSDETTTTTRSLFALPITRFWALNYDFSNLLIDWSSFGNDLISLFSFLLLTSFSPYHQTNRLLSPLLPRFFFVCRSFAIRNSHEFKSNQIRSATGSTCHSVQSIFIIRCLWESRLMRC